jgi:hypothetical protein
MDFEPLKEVIITVARFIGLFFCLTNQATSEDSSGNSNRVNLWSFFLILKIPAEEKSDDQDRPPPGL